MRTGLYVQYGCGLSAPEEWLNFDASPTLRIQKLPLVGELFRKRVDFPQNIKYGNILKRLPGIEEGNCDGIYCSHVLEHLSFNDCKVAIDHTFKYLKPGGTFRCVLPDLEFLVRKYISDLDNFDSNAANQFMQSSLLGVTNREKGIKAVINGLFSNAHHLWMWDRLSLGKLLTDAGFSSVRNCFFNDSENKQFLLVEDKSRFADALAFEAIK